MSKITVSLAYGDTMWVAVDEVHEIKQYSHKWDGHELVVGDVGAWVHCEIELSDEEKISLFNVLIFEDPSWVPIWGAVPRNLQDLVIRIQDSAWAVAQHADLSFRRTPKGVRLPPNRPPEEKYLNSTQWFPVMRWRLDESEKKLLVDNAAELHQTGIDGALKNGIRIPFTQPFDHKQIHQTEAEVNDVFDNLEANYSRQPFWTLYGIAWETYAHSKTPEAAILILMATAETAIKWCIKEEGDATTNFLIDNVPSPPVKDLYQCAIDNTTFEFPKHFKSWLHELATARNKVAHTPKDDDIETLKVARWFATVEHILQIIAGADPDDLVGKKVRLTGEKAKGKVPENTIGIVQRKERFQNTEKEYYHVILETGVAWYATNVNMAVLSNKEQGFAK